MGTGFDLPSKLALRHKFEVAPITSHFTSFVIGSDGVDWLYWFMGNKRPRFVNLVRLANNWATGLHFLGVEGTDSDHTACTLTRPRHRNSYNVPHGGSFGSFVSIRFCVWLVVLTVCNFN